jgi:hypothetical protein
VRHGRWVQLSVVAAANHVEGVMVCCERSADYLLQGRKDLQCMHVLRMYGQRIVSGTGC